MSNLKPFPVIVLGLFLLLAFGSVFILATFSHSTSSNIGKVTIWGSLPESTMQDFLAAVSLNQPDFQEVTYKRIPEEEISQALLEAIAEGNSPDLALLSSAVLIENSDKLLTIPYSSVSRRDFQDSFVQASEIFLTADGIKGIPFIVDPLVMYWNRTLLSNAGIARPPKYWDDISGMVSKLTVKDERGGVVESAASLGTWDNIQNAKAVLLSILHGLNNPVLTYGTDGKLKSTLADVTVESIPAADSAVRFYTEYADPVKPVYSWNRSRPNSKDAFLAGTLALYFGRTSEVATIRAANPNLNFDVALLPSIRGGTNGAEANVIAFSIPRGAVNPEGALAVAQVLSGTDAQQKLAQFVPIPSVRRDLDPATSADPYVTTFRNAALSAFAFLDPEAQTTNTIFKTMIENVLSGRLRISEAVRNADSELEVLVR